MQDSINLLVAYGRGMTRAAQAELGCHRAIWSATRNSLLQTTMIGLERELSPQRQHDAAHAR
jgi:hypothetical protein